LGHPFEQHLLQAIGERRITYPLAGVHPTGTVEPKRQRTPRFEQYPSSRSGIDANAISGEPSWPGTPMAACISTLFAYPLDAVFLEASKSGGKYVP